MRYPLCQVSHRQYLHLSHFHYLSEESRGEEGRRKERGGRGERERKDKEEGEVTKGYINIRRAILGDCMGSDTSTRFYYYVRVFFF